jgi:hypothetical protein
VSKGFDCREDALTLLSKKRDGVIRVGGMADLKLGIKLTGVCDRANARCQSSPMFKVRHSYSVFSARRPASVIRTGATSLMAYSRRQLFANAAIAPSRVGS